MNSMILAMRQAGLVSDSDLARVELAKRKDDENNKKAECLSEMLAKAEKALSKIEQIESTIMTEIAQWMESSGMIVPANLLEDWSTKDRRYLQSQWAKWLSAWRDTLIKEVDIPA